MKKSPPITWTILAAGLLAVWGLAGCGSADGGSTAAALDRPDHREAEEQGEPVEPPFEVRGDARGLLLTWFDEEGPHVAESRTDIPEERRAQVRVDSLELAPEDRDPDSVFVADLRAPREDGRYEVRRLSRDAFDRRVTDLRPAPTPSAAPDEEVAAAPAAPTGSDEIVVFGASWCGACRQAEAYFRSRNIPFVERDIERDPGARAEMQRRARAAGVRTTGIPVIDVRGRVMQGFNPAAIERALRETGGAGGVTI